MTTPGPPWGTPYAVPTPAEIAAAEYAARYADHILGNLLTGGGMSTKAALATVLAMDRAHVRMYGNTAT